MLQNNDLDWDEIQRQYNDVYGKIYSTRDKPNQDVALLAMNFIHQYPQKEIPQLMLNYVADALAEDAVIGLCELLDYQYEYALRKGHYTSLAEPHCRLRNEKVRVRLEKRSLYQRLPEQSLIHNKSLTQSI